MYTNFALEAIEQTFSGTADFGKKVACTISRNGDLIYKTYLEVTLPEITATGGSVAWVPDIGHQLIDNVNLEIGGQEIDKHYGDWLNIWQDLTISPGLKDGFNTMIGNTPALTGPNLTDIPSTELYIPLQFWFCRNAGLALQQQTRNSAVPICA